MECTTKAEHQNAFFFQKAVYRELNLQFGMPAVVLAPAERSLVSSDVLPLRSLPAAPHKLRSPSSAAACGIDRLLLTTFSQSDRVPGRAVGFSHTLSGKVAQAEEGWT